MHFFMPENETWTIHQRFWQDLAGLEPTLAMGRRSARCEPSMFPFPALSTSLEAMAQRVSSHGWYPILWPFQWKDIEPLGEFGTYNNGWISPTNMIITGWCSMEIQKGNNEFTIQMLGCFLLGIIPLTNSQKMRGMCWTNFFPTSKPEDGSNGNKDKLSE